MKRSSGWSRSGSRSRISFWPRRRLHPATGVIDLPALFAILRAAGYEGWLVCEAEQDPAEAHPPTYARMGFRQSVAHGARGGLHHRAIRNGGAAQVARLVAQAPISRGIMMQ
ncbi:MAG: hypothetical protein NUV72_10675 [Bauldia sp.]|nr:hypothetical protein [Bauldia sp.]